RTADRLRRHIARLATEASLLWVEYQAPQDVLNAFGFDPVRDLDLDLGGSARINPIIRSARFKETILPSTYRRMRWNFFRVHFHFLMPNEIPGEYDYPMIVCGPVSLADRIADPAAAVRSAYGTEPGPASNPRNLPQRFSAFSRAAGPSLGASYPGAMSAGTPARPRCRARGAAGRAGPMSRGRGSPRSARRPARRRPAAR